MIIEKLINLFNNFQLVYALEFLLFAITFFFVIEVLRKNKASLLIFVFSLYIIVLSVVFFLGELNGYILLFLIALFVICIIELFATEIKRAVWNKKVKIPDVRHAENSASREMVNECINEIIKALQNMSKNNVGAIIILSNSNMPTAILDSGVTINSNISSQLIESIFFPKTPLHDGAMILSNTKIQAAGCFLPLAQESNLPKELGTRHRAGIGITETINVTSIIVSEETGVISVAHGGKLKRYADTDMLKQTLSSYYWQDII